MYTLLCECRLEEEHIKLRMTPECLDKLFVFEKDDIIKSLTNMRDASTPKLNLTTKIFHVDSFVVLFSSFFLLCGDLIFEVFHPTNLMN